MMKILVVDDEQDLCEILQFNLETEGYEVNAVNSAEEALQLPLSEYGLILLDVMMGDISGFEMAALMRKNEETANIPIIFITALDSEDNMVRGLDMGADDYIVKPLSMKEVKARVKAVLRRVQKDERTPSELVCEGLQLNIDAKTALLDGVHISLTKLEFELLFLFLQNPGKVFGRNELLERCWPSDSYVLDRTVDVNVTRLRKKIGRYGKQIKTRFGYGYCFEK